MEKKYIIKLKENEIAYKTVNSNGCPMIGLLHPAPYTEPDLEQVRKEAYEDGYKTAKVQCNIQAEEDMRDVGKRHYQCGLSDAWDAARKIVCRLSNGGYSQSVLHGIFGSNEHQSIMAQYSASDAVEKIRQYEQEQEEIKVGDEVIAASGKAVVTEVGPVYFEFVYANGAIGSDKVENAKKTGRHFPEIAEVLAKMKEGE